MSSVTERISDQTSGLIQMGARSYDPALGTFASEDSVLGHFGVGVSANRYPHAWDNPANRLDLKGRDVCVFDACAGDALEDVGGVAEETWRTGSYLLTNPGEATTNAVDYWAESESSASYVFGPLATLGDMGLNPDRVAYYLEKANPAQMAATGIVAAGTVGVAGVTTLATGSCYAVTPELEALHVCTAIATTGGSVSATGVILTYEMATR